MMLLVTAALLATTAWALPAGDMGLHNGMMNNMMTTSQPPTAPCCLPKKWQAALQNLKGDGALQYTTVFAFDADRRMEGSVTVPMDGGAPISQSFIDYNNMVKYTVSMADGKCEQSKPDHEFIDVCWGGNNTVTNVKYIGSATLGAKIMYDGWSFDLGTMQITMALARDGCIPLIEGVKDDTANVDVILLYNDVTTTITDTYLLNMPAACASTAGAVVG